ncbi:dihydroorotate dehydrogenase [Alkalihalobacillus oceani]|uniref:dihydroorotate dehydrogenase n=1 Tax=Halalkalibacter oceani TaxID=1653776 RepID=UPI00203CB45F|nr:dihydroorotate dehydrogenase [Halalkalibacter oceani]MCM3760325.1 dihydroorotate dehydrogenase [Halalkalibacter oceani]
MPDWSYHLLFNPIISHLPARTSRAFIHRSMARIARMPAGKQLIHFLGREESSPFLHKEVAGSSFANAIGLSGRIDPEQTAGSAFEHLGFGFLEIGPVTVRGPQQRSTLAIDHREQTITFDRNNEVVSLEKAERFLSSRKRQLPRFIRLRGSNEEVMEIAKQLERFAVAFILERDKDSDAEQLHHLQKEVTPPVFLAIVSSDVEQLSFAATTTCDGIVLDEPDVSRREALEEHLQAITLLKKQGFNRTIVTSGGVYEPADGLRLLGAGADLIMLSAGYVFAGPGLPKRIKEAQLEEQTPVSPAPGWISYWLFGLAMVIGGIISLYLSMTTVILPYDELFLGISRDMIHAFNERLLLFMAHDRMTLAGSIISGGLLYMLLARFGIRQRLKWAKQASDSAAILGFLGIFLFIGYGYFDWLHLLFWLVLLPFFISGFYRTRKIDGTPQSSNRRNHPVWKRGLYAQFCFVILGTSFIIGGIVISWIGVSNVFVSTDLLYLCMPKEMLDAFNEQLIPVIAHDRAGFGSALISVGLLVLLCALWGFHQGNRWVWWMLLVSGLPAFSAGISVHFLIGYTTFIHLLPAYFALSLFIIGLVLGYPFFHRKADD